jgi:hypothetical protein
VHTGVRWEDNIKKYIQEIGCKGVDWADVAFVRVQGAVSCEHGNESSGSIKFGEFPDKLMNYQLLRRDSVPCS